MPVQPGEFWVADIPFTHGTASKRRPILVVWLDGRDLVAAAVTSAAPRSATDVALVDWKASGLRVASAVRPPQLDAPVPTCISATAFPLLADCS